MYMYLVVSLRCFKFAMILTNIVYVDSKTDSCGHADEHLSLRTRC